MRIVGVAISIAIVLLLVALAVEAHLSAPNGVRRGSDSPSPTRAEARARWKACRISVEEERARCQAEFCPLVTEKVPLADCQERCARQADRELQLVCGLDPGQD